MDESKSGILKRLIGSGGSLLDRIDPAGAEERHQRNIRWAEVQYEKSKRKKQVLDEIAEKVLNPEIKSKWQERIKQAIEYFEGKKADTALNDYFMQREDALRNIVVVYLMLAMAHDDFFQMNFIITDELKKMNPELFCWANYIFYCREGRLPYFWKHIKQDLNMGIDLASTKQNDEKSKSQPEKPSAKAKVLATLIEHPDWSNTKIAEAAGISRTSLYDYPEFKAARKMQKQNKEKIPRGRKDQEGNVEAIDE